MIKLSKWTKFSSVAQSCLTLYDPMDCSMTGLPVHHQLPEFIQTHVHWDSDAIQSSHPLSSPSPSAFNLSQHQSLFQWVNLVIKKNEPVIQVTTWRNLKKNTLGEKSQTQKNRCPICHLYEFFFCFVLVPQSCLILSDSMDFSLLGSSVYGILQARILEWVATPFSKGSSRPRDWIQVSCIAGRFFTIWAIREAHMKFGTG